MDVLGYIIICVGIVFMLFGIIGIFQRGKDFYYRLLVACKIDTVGMLTICIGMIVRHGFSFFSGKVLLIVIIIMVLNPLVAHVIGREAQKSGFVSVCKQTEDR